MTPSHPKMLEALIARGFLRRDGDTYVTTPAGEEYTRALIAAYPDKKKLKQLEQ